MQRGVVLQQSCCTWPLHAPLRRPQLQPAASLLWRLHQEGSSLLKVQQQQQQRGWQQRQRRIVPKAVVAPVAGALVLPQLLPASGPWGAWAGLIAAGAFGLWAERHTKLGQRLSGALVATLAGMFLANVGYLPPHAPEVSVVFKYVLPLAIPLLLLSANVVAILTQTRSMLAVFGLGAAATLAASVLAMALFPLGATPLGEDGWKIAAALTARHIGGAVNYVAVAEALAISPSVFGAGLAADDLILTLYFVSIYSLAQHIPPEPEPGAGSSPGSNAASPASSDAPAAGSSSSSSSSSSSQGASGEGGGGGGHGGVGGRTISVYAASLAAGVSGVLCYVGTQLAAAWGVPSQAILITTTLTLAAATALPRLLAPLSHSAEGLSLMLMQLFFAAVGASADVWLVLRTAPVLFCWSAVALAAHLGLLLGVGRLAGISLKKLLLASNANIGGPSTVAGMAAAKGWRSLLVPAILTSTLGYAIGSFAGMGLGTQVLRPMCVA